MKFKSIKGDWNRVKNIKSYQENYDKIFKKNRLNKDMNNTNYKRLAQLGIKVYELPTPHVKPDEVKQALINNKIDEAVFSNILGVNTCLLLEGRACNYPCDIEAALERVLSGKLTGTQLFFD